MIYVCYYFGIPIGAENPNFETFPLTKAKKASYSHGTVQWAQPMNKNELVFPHPVLKYSPFQ